MSGRILIAAIAMLLVSRATFAQSAGLSQANGPVAVDVRVDKQVAQVAEPIRLVLEVVAPRGTRVELPKLGDQLGEFDVRGSKQRKDVPGANGDVARRWVLEATLETIKTGELTIPSLDVHVATDAKATTFETLKSKPVAVRIKSVLENRADPTKFRDIKGTVDVSVPAVRSYAWLGWAAAGIAAATAMALVALAVVKRKRGLSPGAWALAALADLERLEIKNCADAEAAYNEVVDVVREYFELEFGVPTLSRTTREFLAQAAKVTGLAASSRERLASLASLADEIKFARLGVGEPQVRQAIAQAKAFVGDCDLQRRARAKEAA